MTVLPTPNLAVPVTGQPLSQSYLQGQVYNPLNFLLNPPIFKAVATAAQSVASGGSAPSYVNMALDTVSYDTYSGWLSATNTYTIPVSGRYLMVGSCAYAGNSTGNRAVRVSVNGSATNAGSSVEGAAGTNTWVGNVSVIDYFNAGDSIQLQSWQNSGSTLATNTPWPALAIQFLSF